MILKLNLAQVLKGQWGKALGNALQAAVVVKATSSLKNISKVDNLGNPFKGKTLSQIETGFQKQVKAGKLEHKYTDPVSGSKSYKNTKSGYSYNIDSGKSGKTGKKVEKSHVDVNHPNPKPKNVPPKRKFENE